MRLVLALVVISLLFAPAAFGDLTYVGTTANFGSGTLVIADTSNSVSLFQSNLIFNPASNSDQIPDTASINGRYGSSSLTINGGAFNLVETITGINNDPVGYATKESTLAPTDMTVMLSHVSGYSTTLAITNGYAVRGAAGTYYSLSGAIILAGNDVGSNGVNGGTHFVYTNGTGTIDTASYNGIAAQMFVVNNGVVDFAAPVADTAFGAGAAEFVGLSQTAIPRASDFSGVVGGSTTDHVLLADGNYTVQTGASNTMASLQLKNVPVLNMDFNAVNISSGSMIVTGAGTTTITGNGSITSMNLTTNSNPATTSLTVYNTSNLVWDTGSNSNMTLLGSGTITLKQAPSGFVSWQQGSLVWDNDNNAQLTGDTATQAASHSADGGTLTKNGAGTLKVVMSAGIDSLSGIGGMTVNGGTLWLSSDALQDPGYGGQYKEHLGSAIWVNSGTLRVGDFTTNDVGFNLSPSTVVELSGGTLFINDLASQVGAIDIPAGKTGSMVYGGHPGANIGVVPILTGSGTFRVSTDNSAAISAALASATGWDLISSCVGFGDGTWNNDGYNSTQASGFTGDIDVANHAILWVLPDYYPTNAKSLVVEAGGYLIVSSDLTIAGQNIRGKGIINMTDNGLGAGQGAGNTLTINNGQVSPGLQASVGKLTVVGNLAFTGASTVNIRVVGGGAVAGVDYDQLAVPQMFDGETTRITGLANATLHVSIGTNLALKGDVLTIITSAPGAGTAGTLQNFTGSAFGSVVFDNYGVADVTYGNAAITLSRLATAGDVTRNGFVDGGDLNIMLSNWGTGTAGPLTYAMHDVGDVSHNGVVDGGDLNILLSNWGVGVDGQAGVGSAAGQSPEPMTLSLLALGAVGLLRKRRN